MIVGELLAALAPLDPLSEVLVEYDAGCCLDGDLSVRVDGRAVIIQTDTEEHQ